MEEIRKDERTEIAQRMLKDGSLSIEKIAELVDLSSEEICVLKRKTLSWRQRGLPCAR